MKLAIQLKRDKQELTYYSHILSIRGYEITKTGDEYTFWINNLKNIQFFGDYIHIEKEDKKYSDDTKIYLCAIEYFEIHK